MDDLPRGAVTFLFTDIEGSTRLVKQLRDGYGEVLAVHQRLLREAFAQHGGHEIDTQGDAFFVVFASAREALLAAVEGQRALSGYPWPDGSEVRVRMGVHTGQAAPVDGRYTGMAVHRAARIAAAAHGGQVLVSQATQTLLEDEEEDLSVGLRDLGAQRLKDLDRPSTSTRSQGPGLEAEFPPVRGEDDAPPAAEPPLPCTGATRSRSLQSLVALILAAVLAVVLVTRGGGSSSIVEPNRVGAIDPGSNRIVEQVDVGLGPGPLAVGNGFVWVGNVDDRNRIVTRIRLATHANDGTVPIDNRTPTGITAGPLGVWVAEGRVGALARIDPQFGQMVATKEVARPSTNGSVTTGGGSVWAVYGESTLVRVSPVTNETLGTGVVGGRPRGVVFANGLVWVVTATPAQVNGYSPGTFDQGPVTGPFSVAQQPVGIAYDYGNLWVASGDGNVTRIDPKTTDSETIAVGGQPTAITTGEGAVWVTSEDGKVFRIDPSQRKLVKTIDVGNPAYGIAVGGGLVWFSVQAPA